jgi:hypothetical protein
MTSDAGADDLSSQEKRDYYECVYSTVAAGLDELSISSGTRLTLRKSEPGPDGWHLTLEARLDEPSEAVMVYDRVVLESSRPDMDAETKAVIYLGDVEERLTVERHLFSTATGPFQV